jgi:hypothetical protein
MRSDRTVWRNGHACGAIAAAAHRSRIGSALHVGIDCLIPGIGPVQVVLWRCGTARSSPRCLVTNRLDWTPAAVVERYSTRSRIEMFYWSCKQFLGLGDYRVRTALGAVSHWELVFCAHAALTAIDLAKPLERRLGTVGRLCDELAEWTFLHQMGRAYARGRMGMASPLARCAETAVAYVALSETGA